MTKTLPGLGLIAAVVAVAFQINSFQPAISPLALCVGFGFIPTHSSFNQITFTAIFNSGKTSFASRDVSALIKPPIL